MIDRQEVLDLAREFSLRPQVVEKDYALGWLLAGIGQHTDTSHTWVFKGGTCLKKCYFETYRFSEDLDFTLPTPSHLDGKFLLRLFGEIAEWIYERSGLELPKETFMFEVYQNPRGKPSVLGRIGYRGPIAPRGDLPRIRLDLTNDECVLLSPVRCKVHHGFSDAPPEGIDITCYQYEEVFAEKLRALGERTLPRDLYDVVHLYRHPGAHADQEVIMKVLQEKCRFKGVPVPTLEILQREPQRTELEQEWSNMLAHQLPALPPFGEFWNELPKIFDWLTGMVEPVTLQPVAAGPAEDAQWVAPRMAQAWGMPVPLEAIRFAAANRLCVNLGYHGTKRIVEPYALRRTKDGNLILHAIRVDNREHRAYRVDQIQSTEVTQRVFTPVYTVELTPTGPLHAPMQTRIGTTYAGGRIFSSRRRTTLIQTPKYIVECSMCGKRFTRSKIDSKLRSHKTKNGYPCYGGYGHYVETKYS